MLFCEDVTELPMGSVAHPSSMLATTNSPIMERADVRSVGSHLRLPRRC